MSYRLGFLTQADEALEQRSRMIINGQLLRYEFRAVEWIEVGEFRVVTERKNSSLWQGFRQSLLWPKVRPSVSLPSSSLDPIATKSVYEDDAG
jgi:hypothetical protein